MKRFLRARAAALLNAFDGHIASWRRPDLFVLLGAGASIPGILSTTDVTAKLTGWPFFGGHPSQAS
jgi:hypothetical protein